MNNTALKIASAYLFNENVKEVKPHGEGLINNTYVVTCESGTEYILQKINTQIFTKPEELQQNIAIVTQHLEEQLKTQNYSFNQTLNIIQTQDSNRLMFDDIGGAWRVFTLIPNTHTIQQYTNTQLAKTAGNAFADFHAALSNLDPQLLHDSIPNFHNISLRIDQFTQSVNKTTKELKDKARNEIKRAENQMAYYKEMYEEIAQNCPLRIVHQDTKINNLLFDKNNKVEAVIDLDTVMPGYAFIDFGDALRVAGNSEDENSTNFEAINFKLELFDAFAEGYVGKAKDFLTKTEINSLGKGIELLVYEQGIRFLSDYLNGSTYYKVNYDDHNLDRAKNQFTYLEKVIEQRQHIQNTINNCIQ